MYTVLIVEDEILVSVGLKNMVRWADMNMMIVGEARNGQQGLDMYREKKPDLILTDIKMPVMDGIEMIKQIRKEDSRTQIVVLTGYEDFELVRESFMLGISDYILKLKMMPEEIEVVIRKVYNELLCGETLPAQKGNQREEQEDKTDRARIRCRDIILQTASKSEGDTWEIPVGEIRKLAGILQIAESELTVCVMETFSFREEPHAGYQEEKVEQIILNLIRNIVSEYCEGDVFPQKNKKYLFLLSLINIELQEREELLRDMFLRIKTSIQTYVNIHAVFGISSGTDSFGELGRLYTEAVEALTEAYFYGENMVFFGKEDMLGKYEAIMTAFEEKIEELDLLGEDYRWKIRKEIAILKRMDQPKGEEIKEILIRWIHQCSLERSILKEEMLKTTLRSVEKIRSTVSLTDMLRAFEECVLIINQSMKEFKTVKKEVEETVSYIMKHYCEKDISVANAAQVVGLNKDYLSNLFKKEMGISFSDYVNMQRIKKAKELLLNTHLKSYQIAYQVGFQDEGYFSRVFKKAVGMRPSEYKRDGFFHVDTLNGGKS